MTVRVKDCAEQSVANKSGWMNGRAERRRGEVGGGGGKKRLTSQRLSGQIEGRNDGGVNPMLTKCVPLDVLAEHQTHNSCSHFTFTLTLCSSFSDLTPPPAALPDTRAWALFLTHSSFRLADRYDLDRPLCFINRAGEIPCQLQYSREYLQRACSYAHVTGHQHTVRHLQHSIILCLWRPRRLFPPAVSTFVNFPSLDTDVTLRCHVRRPPRHHPPLIHCH